ncbi:MAG: hypothetical protein AABY32_02750 [Nanoarchaeota archaeon]
MTNYKSKGEKERMKYNSINLSELIPNFDSFRVFINDHKDIVDTGKLAQFYCEKLLDLKGIKPFNTKGMDLESRDGKIKYEVKYRKGDFSDKTPIGMEIDLSRINYVLYVELNPETLLPNKIFKIKSEDIQYKKGKRVSFNKAFKDKKIEAIIIKQNEKTKK